MKVRATRTGVYRQKRIREGQVFELIPIKKTDKKGKEIVVSAEKQFSENWMERFVESVESPAKEQPKNDGKATGDKAVI